MKQETKIKQNKKKAEIKLEKRETKFEPECE